VTYKPVTSENRFAAVASGEVDIECGSTTANIERRRTADFSPIHFIAATKLLVKRGSPIRSYRDLGGKKVAVTTGTTNADAMRALVSRLKIAAEIVEGRDHADSFAMVKDGRADTLALDDILLYGLIAAAGDEGSGYQVLPDELSYEPYGLMFRKDDPAFSGLVTGTFQRLAQSREIRWIYERWFSKRLPNGQRLNVPMSEQLLGLFQMLGLPD
jgi:glutamate/aspartate transport system substrate-binding protein